MTDSLRTLQTELNRWRQLSPKIWPAVWWRGMAKLGRVRLNFKKGKYGDGYSTKQCE